jgi:hypothetical protein
VTNYKECGEKMSFTNFYASLSSDFNSEGMGILVTKKYIESCVEEGITVQCNAHINTNEVTLLVEDEKGKQVGVYLVDAYKTFTEAEDIALKLNEFVKILKEENVQ